MLVPIPQFHVTRARTVIVGGVELESAFELKSSSDPEGAFERLRF